MYYGVAHRIAHRICCVPKMDTNLPIKTSRKVLMWHTNFLACFFFCSSGRRRAKSVNNNKNKKPYHFEQWQHDGFSFSLGLSNVHATMKKLLFFACFCLDALLCVSSTMKRATSPCFKKNIKQIITTKPKVTEALFGIEKIREKAANPENYLLAWNQWFFSRLLCLYIILLLKEKCRCNLIASQEVSTFFFLRNNKKCHQEISIMNVPFNNYSEFFVCLFVLNELA